MNKLLLLSAVAVLLLTGCNYKKKKEQEQKVIHDIDQLVADLPAPSEVPLTLKSIDVPFTDSLVNSLDNLEKYQGNRDKLALNMGVYAADVSYLACYQKEHLTMAYVRTCHEIGETLGDSAIFKEDLIQNIKASLNDEDKLSEMLRQMIVQTSIQLERDHHLSMAAMALAGIWVEEMYQAVNIIENYHLADLDKEATKAKMEPLIQLVLSQEKPLADLIKLFEDIPHDDKIRETLSKLRILQRLYENELAAIEKEMQKDPDYIVDKNIMRGIAIEIEDIRAGFIE